MNKATVKSPPAVGGLEPVVSGSLSFTRAGLTKIRVLLPLLALLYAASLDAQQSQLQKVTINYAARTGTTWPLYLAKEGGYYEKYGLDVSLVFGVHPAGIAMVVSGQAVMTNYTMEQAMQAASKDGSLEFVASSFKKSLFSLMAKPGIGSVKDLKGKHIGVSQIGDAPYNYAVGLLAKFGLTPRDVEWIPIGGDVNARAAALISGRVDASMLTAPVYFRLEAKGFKSLANISDYDDIYAPTVSLFKKATVASNPKLVEAIIKAQAEAIKRFYDDKPFAIKTYLKYSPAEEQPDVERVYDRYSKGNTFERVPYVLAPAVQYQIDHAPDPRVAAQMKAFNFHEVIDNSIVQRLVREGFFEKLFGPGIKAEETAKARIAFGQ
ncbi:MAG TPA: ABC transporter substrate-binding protein [Bryobacteraceae bacterium]|nr:ABC transporter substrate-binding protein [Bryobacteraceae bacterium]